MRENPHNKFDAFISYRHSELDKSIADKLHNMLETYKVPRSILKKTGRRNIERVFRDRDELPTSSSLADNINEALANSDYLIVICSPRTPQSQWVLKEIETFSAIHGHDRILALLIEGEPDESFPLTLRTVRRKIEKEDGTFEEQLVEIEPLAADIRADGKKAMIKKLKIEMLRLLAPIFGCRFDDLRQRHRERAIKRIAAISVFASLFFLGFGSFSAYQAIQIKQQSQKTLMGQSLYMANISTQLMNEGDRRTAALVAREALPADLNRPDRPYVEEAEYALGQALEIYKYDNRIIPDIALKHRKDVNFIKVSGGGKTAVSSAQDGYLYIWDTVYGNLLDKYYADNRFMDKDSLYFLDDSSILILMGDGPVCLDIDTMTVKWQYQCYSSFLATDPSRKVSALVTNEDVIIIDNLDGKETFRYSIKDYLQIGDLTTVNSICLDETGKYLGVGTSQGDVLLFDIDKKALMTACKSQYAFIRDVAVSGSYIAAASCDFSSDTANILSGGNAALDLFDLSGKKLVERQFDNSSVKDLRFDPFDKNLLVFTEGEKLNILSIPDDIVAYSFLNGGDVTDYAILDGFVITASYDGTIRYWMMTGDGYEYDTNRVSMPAGIKNLDKGAGIIVFSQQGSDKAIVLRNLQNDKIERLSGAKSSISGCSFSPDGSTLLSYSFSQDQSQIILWDWNSRKIRDVINHAASVNYAWFTDGGKKILVSDSNSTLSLYDSYTLELLTSKTFDNGIYSGAVSADGKFCVAFISGKMQIVKTANLGTVCELASTGADTIRFSGDDKKIILLSTYSDSGIFDVSTGAALFGMKDKGVTDAAFSSDGKLLACVYGDNGIHVIDTENYRDMCIISNVDMKVVRILFAPNSKTFFAGLDDGSVRRYDSKTGRLIAELQLSQNLDSISFSADKSLFMTMDENKETILWRDQSNKKIGMIHYILGISPDSGEFITPSGNDLLLMPVYDTRALLDEAKRQLGSKTLTEGERQELYILK